MSEQKIWYVYKHTNKVNNKCYIGITSQQPLRRWKRGYGYYNNIKFYSAIQKYGWNSFQHEILYQNLTLQEACQKQKQLILFYNSIKNGYNATEGGEGIVGYHHTEQKKEQISLSMKKYLDQHPQEVERRKKIFLKPENWEKRTQKVNEYFKAGSENAKKRVQKNNKKIICLNTGQIFNSIQEASNWCKVHNSGISKCLKGIQKTAGKHPITKQPLKWQYYND